MTIVMIPQDAQKYELRHGLYIIEVADDISHPKTKIYFLMNGVRHYPRLTITITKYHVIIGIV